MNTPRTTSAALLVLALSAGPVPAFAASPAEIAATRQASLDDILNRMAPNLVGELRMNCMFGKEPDKVSAGRRAGQSFLPDAADICVAVLRRTARDGHLPDLFRTVISQLGGNADGSSGLPLAIGNAVLDGNGSVSLGNGKQISTVPPPLAFDAGFTVAYLKGDTRAADKDPVQLKLAVEDCLAVHKNAGTCFSVGYVEGGRALLGSK